MNVSERMATNLVTLEEEDIPGLITLSAAVEWDYDKYEIQTCRCLGARKHGSYAICENCKGSRS